MAIGKAAWRIGFTALLLSPPLAIWMVHRFGADIAREIALRELGRVVPAEVRFGQFEVSALPPRVIATDLEIWDRGTRLIAAPRVQFDLAVVASLWQGAWIGDIAIEQPSVVYRDGDEFWKRLRAVDAQRGGAEELPVLPRSLSVRSGRMTVEFAGLDLRASVDDLAIGATLGGLVRVRVRFDTTAKVVLERAGRRLELRRVAALGRAAADDVRVDAGVIDGQSGSLRWAGRLRRQRLDGRLDWEGTLDPIFALIPEAPPVHGGARIRSTIDGPVDHPVVVSELQARSVRIADVEFSGEGRLTSRGDEWTLEQGRAQIFGGEAEGSAHGRFVSRVPFELTARFHDWDPAVFIRLFGPQTPVRGAWRGEGRLSGHLLGYDLRGGGQFSLEQASEKLTGDATFTVAKDSVEVAGKIGAGDEDRLRCRYQVVGHSRIAGEAEGKSRRLGLFGTFVNLRLEGQGSARAEFAGTVDKPSFRGAAELAELSVEGIRFGDVRGPFEISADGLRSDKVVVENGEVEASGRIALTARQENDWSAAVRHGALARGVAAARIVWPRLPDLGGNVDGELKVAGPWSDLRLHAQAEVTESSVETERLGTVGAEVSLERKSWAARASLRRDDGALAEAQGKLAADGAISGQGSGSGWKLENIESLGRRWPALHGTAGLKGTFGGTLVRPVGEAVLRVSHLSFARQEWGDGSFRLRLDGAQGTLEGAVGERIHLSLATELSRAHAFRLRGEWHDLDVGPALVPETGLEIRSAGSGQLDGDIVTPLGQGSARISELRVGRGDDVLTSRGPVVVRVEKGAVEIADAELEGRGQRFRLGARLTAEESEFHAIGTGDLALLESISPSVASAQGRIDVELRGLRRAAGSWGYHGRATIAGGALDLALLVGITDIAGEVNIEGRQVELRELTGKVGGGELLVAGVLGLDSGWDLGWAIHEASLGIPSWLDYRASGNGRLAGGVSAPKLAGEIEVTQAVYDRRIEWAEFLPWFRRQARPLRTASGVPVALDLHLVADGGLFMDNNLVKAEMRGDLRLRGSSESLVWDGTLEVLSGEVLFRRRRFAITSGTVRFHEDRPTDPDLELDGETSVTTREAEYQISLRVDGSAENPRIQFTADDPSLTENDVLALVTFGSTVAQLEGEGGGIELGEVLAVTGPPGGRVEEKIHDILRIDRIEIEPAYSRVSGVSEPRLRIAKDITDRFSAVVGTGLGSERQHDVGLEYQLTPRLSVQGLWESQTKSAAGTFGGALKFRLPFRSFTLLPESFQRLAAP